jgi:hypothetical protein
MRRTQLFVLLALLVASLALPGHADASNPPADMESHAPLTWNPFGVRIVNIYWDNNWDANNPGFTRANIDAATAALTNSDYFEKTSQYGVPGRSFAGSVDALGICGSDPGTGKTFADLELFMTCESSVPVFGLSPDFQGVIYNVFVPARTNVDTQNGERMCQNWRAYHSVTASIGIPPEPVYFSVNPIACMTNVSDLMSAVSHEDAEILTDPIFALYWYDADSAVAAGFPSSVAEALDWALHDRAKLVRGIEQMHSEVGDLCESASPYAGVPADFGLVPETPFGIPMQLASYWSNADHACVVGDERVVEAAFSANGLPPGAGSVLVDNFTRPIGYTHSMTENTPYTFAPSVIVGGDRYVIDSGNCSGTVGFPAGSTSPNTQMQHLTCNYRKQGAGPGAIVYSNGCAQNALPRNDDGSFGPYALSFQPDFFGTTYNSVFVNNNGNVTFDRQMSDFTPFPLTTTHRVVIAPFFGDVDTRSGGSRVTWGTTTFAGRPAFCVLWADVGVNYYYAFSHTDKLNGFQLLLVDRSDIGPGDFDIVMNYDQVQWETGDASGGSDGLGGSSARVGYSNGDPASSFELPGSAVNGALLDSSPSGLVHGSRNSAQLGRYIFAVRNGLPPAGGVIGGQITGPDGNPVANGPVQVCPSAGGPCIWNGFADSRGVYDASGIPEGSYTVTAFPPAGSNLLPSSVSLFVPGSSHVGADIRLQGAAPPPPGTSISPSGTGGDGLPVLYWRNALTLTTQGCAGGTATYAITNLPSVYALGSLTEGPAGTYTASVPALYPSHGNATVGITIHCPSGGADQVLFDIYIDPSGAVETTTGQPLAGATVTLYRSDSPTGPFVEVPDGNAIMSPANRHNPDATDAGGHFGWNVITGYYFVRASHPGCQAPDDPSRDYVDSPVVQIPPAVLDLDLRLACDTTPPATTAAVSPQPNAAGWNRDDVTVTLDALDNPGGSGVASITYSAAGAQPIEDRTVLGATSGFQVTTEGTTTVSYFARDLVGNVGRAHTLVVKLDKTAPQVTVTRSPGPNANGWNNGPVTVHFAASDDGSGIDGAATTDVTISGEGMNQSASATFRDVAGNERTFVVGPINVDLTAPVVTCSMSPAQLWPPDHGLAVVTAGVTVADALSGPAGFVLVSVQSSEPDNGVGDGDAPNDVQDWTVGTPDASGELRAERAGNGPGRVYAFVYDGVDNAGNTSRCTTTVTVPHDRK